MLRFADELRRVRSLAALVAASGALVPSSLRRSAVQADRVSRRILGVEFRDR